MTKIRNTKKGMAKKTLSISLAVAMLATSNVPVWAAEDLFTDGAAAVETVEAPVEDVFSDAAEEVVEEAPVVEEEEVVDGQAINDENNDVNLDDYAVKDLKIGAVGAWGTEVSVEGSVKDAAGADVTLNYTWMADGVQAAGNDATGTDTTLSNIKYTPTFKDFNKELSLRIFVVENGTARFSKTIKAAKAVQPKDISTYLKDEQEISLDEDVVTGEVVYNGTEQKPAATIKESFGVDVGPDITTGEVNVWKNITNDNIYWHYETEGNDFTNVTEKNITVYGTLNGTYDVTSPVYGFTGTTNEETYKITPFAITKLAVTLLNPSVVYTGAVHTFGKADVKVEVPVSDTLKVDITAALDKDTTKFTGDTANVGSGHNITVDSQTSFADTEEADKILKNFERPTTTIEWDYTNRYEVTKLDLSKCTATANREFKLDEFRSGKYTVDLADITLTIDGKSFSLTSLVGDVDVQVNSNVFSAVNANKPGEVKNAFTINYKNDSTNVTNSKNVDINLVVESLGNVFVLPAGKDKDTAVGSDWIKLSTSKASINASTKIPYIGKAYSLTGNSGVLHTLTVNTPDNSSNIDKAEYSVAYKNITTGVANDTTNAGIIEVTITANANSTYRGSKAVVYFQIAQDEVEATEIEVKNEVSINPANNHDASLYKEALATKIETGLANGTEAVLKEGTDYTVKYYYVKSDATISSVTDIKNAANEGTNNVGDKVYAVATLTKDGNYTTSAELYACATIVKKSISNVTVAVEKDSYTFTGKEIVADITVKDGSVVLEKGVDYTLKFKDNIDVGTATVTVVPTATSDYNAGSTATATFEITPAKAEDVKVTFAGETYNYTGKQIKPVIGEITLNGVNVKKYFDVTYPTYGENVNAGKEMGSVTIAPKTTTKNFTGTKTQLFDIKGKELKGYIRAYYGDKTEVQQNDKAFAIGKDSQAYSFFYDGQAQTFADARFFPSASYNVKDGVDYEVKYINNVDAGTAFVAVVAKGNYEGALTWDFGNGYKVKDGQLLKGSKVIEKNIVDIMAFNIEPSYFTARNITVKNGTYAGGKPVKPEVAVVVNGRTLVEGKDYTLELRDIENASTPDTFVDVTADKPYYVTVLAKGGYKFSNVNGSNAWTWGIDKKDLADCDVTVTKNGEDFDLKVMNGNVVEIKEAFDVTDNGDGTATVSVIDGGKNYTGSATVAIVDPEDKGAVGMVEIADVKVDGNKATVILTGEAENADGYDYVISTEDNYDKNGRVSVTKNQLKTTGDFFYVQKGTYYAYCHAYRRDENGIKVFSPEFSKTFKFTVTAITPEKPAITSVTRKGNNVTVTYTTCKDATGYDVVLGTANRVVNGERRPVDYGTLVKKNLKEGTTSVTFKNVPEGTYYAGLHAFNRSRQDNNNKVFSPWSDSKTVTVK